jgi:exopolysaccharide biosynthesis WecB/TagA/CpsF family protein
MTFVAKILIVGINYRPETSGIAPYTTDFAEHLAAAGHSTTVITGFPHYPAWRLQHGESRWRATEIRSGVRVLRRRHYVPRSQSAARRAMYEGSFLVHGALSRTERPDAVFGVIPSLSGGLLARFFAARARAPYGLIVQDLMAPAARQSGIRGGTRVAGATAFAERWAMARAHTVATASESFRPYLRELGVDEHRILDLPNWTHVGLPTADRAATRERLGWPPDRTVVLHAGNMGLKQGLEQVIEAARRADSLGAPSLFVLMGDGSQRTALESKARGVQRIRFLPFQPEDEVPDVLNAADVLLVSERASVIDMSLPSKLTSYFAAGRPIVGAVPAAGSTAREIVRSRAGVIIPTGDPDTLNSIVAELQADPQRVEALGSAGRAYAASALDLGTARARMDLVLERTLDRAPRRPRAPARRVALDRPSFQLLGVRINAAPFADVLDKVLRAPRTGDRLSLHFATAHMLVMAQESAQLREALGAGLVQPDGMPLVWLGRRAGLAVERVCGPDLLPAVIQEGIPEGRTHFFYGGAPGVPEALAARMATRYPGMRVAGTLSPPFRALSRSEEDAVIARINDAEPDFVWVGLGTPKQDLWVAANRPRLNASALLAVGAAFDFHAGRRRRAPQWMQRSGTEWIYRLGTEPRRLAGRYTATNARFVRLVAEERMRAASRRR